MNHTPRTTIVRLLVAAVALVLLASACGGEKSVGDESLLEGTDQSATDIMSSSLKPTRAPYFTASVIPASTPTAVKKPCQVTRKGPAWSRLGSMLISITGDPWAFPRVRSSPKFYHARSRVPAVSTAGRLAPRSIRVRRCR